MTRPSTRLRTAGAAGTAFLAVLMAGCTAGDSGSGSPAAGKTYGTPAGQRFVNGVQRPEDLFAVPGTSWVVVSSQGHGKAAGKLQTVDSTNGQVKELWPAGAPAPRPDPARYPDCPGPPDAAAASPHGIGIRSIAPDRAELLVVNHGGRESIEAFDLDLSKARPVATWVGCVLMPSGTSGNGVASLPDGSGFAVTNFVDPSRRDGFKAMFDGQDTGDVRVWRTADGWRTVPGSAMGGPNGLLVTPDGSAAIVAAWPARRVVRLPLAGGPPTTIAKLHFLPDNLRWDTDGTILTTGQDLTYQDILTCNAGEGTDCPVGYSIMRIDPANSDVSTVFRSEDQTFGLATVAAPVGNEIWVGTLGADRIARVRDRGEHDE
ncbi:hypothetical protein ACFC96_13000 [Streptomyces sp. NPDC055955]|uniref:hypothetical protein n=1 Tax=Streptomyces sp. NPDC055955 TaxID=3345665 RepID=UPI0035D961D2